DCRRDRQVLPPGKPESVAPRRIDLRLRQGEPFADPVPLLRATQGGKDLRGRSFGWGHPVHQKTLQSGQACGSDYKAVMAMAAEQPAAWNLIRIEPAHACVQSRQPEKDVDAGGRHADMGADLAHGRDQRIELDRAPGLDVLQHGSLEGAELARHLAAVLAALGDRAADACAYGFRLLHDGEAEAMDERIVQ